MKPFKVALIFTGHMVDLPGRDPARFPPELEAPAQKAVERRITQAKRLAAGSIAGIASGARGGDILFLEGCRKAGLPFYMILPFARERFVETSVRGLPEGDWERRFHALWECLPARNREALEPPEGQNAYEFCNRRMLALARELGKRFRLLALWDGKQSEPKAGGTASFVELVRQSGGHFAYIDTGRLLRKLGS